MAKQLNVNLAMTADTSKAKAELQSLQKQLNDLMLSAQKNDSSLGLSKDIQHATQMAAQLKVQLEAATGSTGKLDLTKFNDQLRKSKTSISDYQKELTKLGPAGTQAFSNLASSIMQAEVPLRRANKALDEFATSLANTARWQLSSSILHGFMGAIQGAYRYAQDLNESLNNIRIVTGNSTEQMSKFALEANKAAKALSTTTTSYTDAALIYYQQGLSEKEVKARTDATIKMANVSRQSAEEVSSQMTAIWNNFAKGGEDLEYYADVITKLGAATASSSDEIAQGLQKFASVADTVGLSYEKATAALATVVAETRQSADVVGTAFKTMFARFQGLQLGETLEDGVGLNKYSAALAKVGVQILDANGDLKNMDIILDDIAERWNNISNAQQVALAETVAGTRQYAQFMAIMNNYDKILANQKLGASSRGTLNQQAEIYAESWEAAEKRVKAAAQGIYDDLISDDFFITMLNGFEKALSFVDQLIKNMGGLKGVLVTVSGLVTTIFNKQITNAAGTFINDLKMLTPVGRQEVANRREEAVQGLYDIANSGKGQVGEAMKSVYSGQAELSKILLTNAEHMTEEQKKQAAILLDINKTMGQEVINAAKLAEEAKKTTTSLGEQQLRQARLSKSKSIWKTDQTYNEGLTAARNIQEKITKDAEGIEQWKSAARELSEITKNIPEDFSAANDETKELINNFKNFGSSTLQNLHKDLGYALDDTNSFKEALALCDKGLENLTPEELERLKQAIQECRHETENFDNSANILTDTLPNDLQSLTTVYQHLGMSEKEAADAAKHFLASAADSANKTYDAKDAALQHKNALDREKESMQQLGEQTYKTGQLFGGFTSALMSVASAINSIKSLGNIWNSEDLTTGEKITQSLTMLIPLLNSYQGVQQLQTAVNLKLAASNAALQLSMWQIYLIIGAIIAIVAVLIKAYEKWKAATPEGQLEAAKKATEDAKTAAEEAQTAYDNLKSTIENYKFAVNRIKELEKGTDEYKEAIIEANNEAKKLIELYGSMPFTVENGVITFKEEDINNAKNAYQKRLRYANSNYLLSQNKELEAKNNVLTSDFYTKNFNNYGVSTNLASQYTNALTEHFNTTRFTDNEQDRQLVIDYLQSLYPDANLLTLNNFVDCLIDASDALENYTNSLKENNKQIDNNIQLQLSSDLLYNDKYMNSQNQEAILSIGSSKFTNIKNRISQGSLSKESLQNYSDIMDYGGYSHEENGTLYFKDKKDNKILHSINKEQFISNLALDELEKQLIDTIINDVETAIKSAGNGGNVISAVLSGKESTDIGYSIYKNGFKYNADVVKSLGYSEDDVNRVLQNSANLFTEKINNVLSKINGGPAGAKAGQQFMKFFESTSKDLSDQETDNLFNQLINTDWSNIESIQELQIILEELGIDLENANWDNFVKGMQQAVGYIDDFSGLEEEIKNVLTILNGLEFGKSIKEEDYKAIIAYNDAWASLFQLTTDGYRFLGDTKTIIGEATGLVSEKIKQLQFDSNLQNRTASNADIYLNQETASDYANLANSDEGFQALLQRFGYNIQDVILQNIDFDELKKRLADFFDTDFAENIDNIRSYAASTATSFAMLDEQLKEGLIEQKEYDEQTKVLTHNLKEQQETAIENAKSFDDLATILTKAKEDGGLFFDQSQFSTKIREIAEEALSSAKSLAEFDEALKLATEYGIKFSQQQLGGYLINLGNQYENCATQITKYQNALKSGNYATIKAEEDSLRAAITVNDLSKKYSLNSKTVDAHARMIKKQADELSKGNKELKMSAEQAVELAVRNERMNAGVKKLNENFGDLEKTLKNSKNTSMDYANAFYQIEDAISDLIGAADDFELPEGFLDIPENLDLIRQAAEGSQHAINQLGISITTSNLESVFETIRDQFGQTDQAIDDFKTQLMSIPKAIQDNLEALENGKSLSDIMGDDLNKGIEALNKFIIAAGYTREQVNAMLSGIGAKADIKMITVQQDTEVPEYETHIEPLTTGATGSQIASDFGATGRTAGKFSNLAAAMATPLPLVQGFKSYTVQTGVRKVKGYTQVPQIAINGKAGSPSLSFVGVGGGGTAGGVSNTSLGGGTKSGGGGGSSPTRSTKQHAQPSSNPYQGIEKQIDRLNSQYNKLERARNRAYGEGALSIIKQEIEKTKELANAQRDYIKAIAGDQGLNFAKIIEQGGDLGAAIKAAGGGGGQLGKAYKELLYGKNDAFEITMKDSDGNETTVSKSTSGIGMDIKISSTGVIENYNELEQHIYDKYNAEVDWWNKLSADEQQDPNNIARMEAAEKTRDIELDQLSTVQDQLDVLWDQSDKLAEIRDGLYDLNYSLLSEKIHLKVDIAERQLKFLQYQIKILGDNIYKIPEAMNKLFGGGDSVYGKLQNLANTWKDAFYEAQSLYGLDPEQGGISAADYADMIKQAQDGLYNVIDQLLDMNEQMRNYYKKALQGVLNEMQAITNQMEHQVSIVSHLRNILSLLGRETDWTAMTGLIQGQMHMQHNNYQVSRQQAAMLKGEVQRAYANLADIQASGASEDAVNEFKQAVLQPAIEAAIQAEEKMYSDLEAFIQSINDLFDVFKNKALSEFEDAITGIYGSFDYLNSSMERAQSIADEYLTTTNKLYETNELMRKLAQDMDKTDSAYAKRKLKNFSDEIQQLQNREKLTKSEMDFAKARYELLLAEIALTEAQNAKSTVRLQRDNEGNYGYVYTADRDAVDNAEQNLVEKQNNLYNLALEKYNEYSQKLIQLNSEEKAALDELWTQYKEGSIASWDEYLFKRNEIVDQYDQQREALSITYYEAQKILDETAATDYHEAWASSYEAVVEKSIDSHNEITDLINEMDGTLHWLDSERAAITAEAQLDTQGMIATVGQLTAENDKLAAEMVNNVIPKAQALLSTVNDLTAAWAKQYDQIMALIQEYMDLIAVMQQALEQLAAGDNAANNQSNLSYDPNTDYSLLMANYLKEDSSRTQQDEEYLRLAALRQAKITGENLSKDFYKLENSEIDPYIKEYVDNDLTGWIYYEVEKLRAEAKKIPGLATGGYTGEWGSGGKLALLHQKELVLNEADTENILASVKIIRQIADAIGLRAAAANTESSISPGFISNQGALEQSVTIHAEFPNATNHDEIEEAFASLINRATQFAGRISANTDRE